MKKINDCIHIRPNIKNIDETILICNDYSELKSHVIMLSATNFTIIMHDKKYKCFVCNQISSNLSKEKHILK